MKKKTIISALLSLAAMTIFGCGGGGGGGTTAPPAGSTTLSGVAAKGPISGGTVKVFNITNGAVDRTAEIGSGTSDGSGNYSISILADKKPAGPVLVEVSGGTFTDEATGTAVTLKTPLQAAVSTVVDGDKIAITPFTHLAVKQVEGIGTFSEQEINDANLQIGKFFEVEDIIHHQPFDSTKDAPADATDDRKKYSGALGVFSQMVNRKKGKTGQSLDDALVSLLGELETELHDNGGFSTTTRDEFNASIDDFSTSGKNKGGAIPTKVVFTGGVLQLSTAGTLPANTAIEGFDITITIPAGVTFSFDATTGEAAAGVVVPSSKAATGSISTAKFDPATSTLHIVLINVQPGIAVGEFLHVEFTGAPPAADLFVVKVNAIQGGSTTDPNAALVDLSTSGLTIKNTVAGL